MRVTLNRHPHRIRFSELRNESKARIGVAYCGNENREKGLKQ